MNELSNDKKKLQLKQEFKKYEEEAKIIGWDFSILNSMIETEKLNWEYKDLVLKYLNDDKILLDQGTGGGEFLLSLHHPYDKTYVTEGYNPNYKLCCERLIPLGIKVYEIQGDNNTPFLDDTFDLIINRHESYNLEEVRRILKPNGLFITQQVGSLNNKPLIDKLTPKDIQNNFELKKEIVKFINNDFEIIYSDEAIVKCKYKTIQAVIIIAKTIQWEFPGFSVDSSFEGLLNIYEKILKQGYFESSEHRFVIVSKKRS